MLKKRMMILLIIYVLTFSLVGCGKVDETTNTGKNTTQQQTTASNKTTEDSVTTTEEVVTTETINQLQMDSMENPLQFGNVVTIHTEYMPNPMDVYELETEISITDYENEYISCDVKLIDITPCEGSQKNQDIYFDCNFLMFTLYDENYVPIDYGYPINSSEGVTQGESNKLTRNQVLKGQIGPLKGSYDGAIPKYISFEYAREYSEQSYIPYYVYYEIPDGLFDTSYINVDMSVMGADSAEQALELFKEALNNDDANIAKKISLYYYTCYEKTGRVLLEDWECMDYLGIYKDTYIDSIKEEVNQDNFSVTTLELWELDYVQQELEECGGIGYLQAGYSYSYSFPRNDGWVGNVWFDIYLFMCDGRWFCGFYSDYGHYSE